MKDGKWYTRWVPIFNWDPQIYGNDILVHWTELDGGSSTTTITVTFPPNNGMPGNSYSFTTKSDNDDLGYQLAQYETVVLNPDYIYSSGLIQWKLAMIF